MRSAFFGAALLAFSFMPSPAQAANPLARQMLQVARRAGVTYSIADQCGRSGNALATFTPSTRHMCMTRRVMSRDKDLAFEVLTHEMVHAAQACLNEDSVLLTAVRRGVITMASAKRILNTRIDDQDNRQHVERVVAMSRTRSRALHEAEAYALQRSPKTVLALLASSCNQTIPA